MNHLWRTTRTKLRTESRSYHTIEAVPRIVSGPEASNLHRKKGKLPTLVVSSEPSRNFLLLTRTNEISSLIHSVGPDFFRSTLFKLNVWARPGSDILLHSGFVLPKKIEYMWSDPTELLNLKLAWADEGSRLQVDVPLVFKGEESCPGILKGGQFKPIQTKLKYLCPAKSIPQKIEVDVSNLDVGDQILPKDIQVDPSFRLMSRNVDLPICQIETLVYENRDVF